MVKLHGAVYLIIGIFVTWYSWFVGKKMVLFLWLGIGLIVLGLVKIAYLFFNRKKEGSTHVHESKMASYCHKCGNLIKEFDQFCSRCGERMFHRK